MYVFPRTNSSYFCRQHYSAVLATENNGLGVRSVSGYYNWTTLSHDAPSGVLKLYVGRPKKYISWYVKKNPRSLYHPQSPLECPTHNNVFLGGDQTHPMWHNMENSSCTESLNRMHYNTPTASRSFENEMQGDKMTDWIREIRATLQFRHIKQLRHNSGHN